MRYGPEHRAITHQKIVKDASRRVRAEGLSGAAVSAVMRDAGLTHGGFYKHFKSKDALVLESLRKAFEELADFLTRAAQKAPPDKAWKEIVKTYLSVEHCDHAERGCPVAALASELARADEAVKTQIQGEIKKYKNRMLPYMPGMSRGRQRAGFPVDYFNDAWGDCNRPPSSGQSATGKNTLLAQDSFSCAAFSL